MKIDGVLTGDPKQDYEMILFLYESALKKMNTKIEILEEEFIKIHHYDPIEHISKRLKSEKSIARKCKREGHDLTIENMISYLNDIAGIRIVCSFTSDIYLIADMISNQEDIRVLLIKNYIENPKPNGYKSYHMIVTIPIYISGKTVDVKVEIQIRTIAMDFWASLEHKIYYKYEGNAPDYMKAELTECAKLIHALDDRMLSLNNEIRKIEGKNQEEEI